MSTRRARIKAVTSLPPRRKNADKRENKANKPDDVSGNVDQKSEGASNVDNATDSLQTADKINDKESSLDVIPERPKDVTIDVIKSPDPKANTVSVIRPNVFLSPQKRSPRKTFATPIAPSPKILKTQDHRSVIQRTGGTPVTQKINDCDELQISNSLINKINYNEDLHKKDGSGPPTPLSSNDDPVMDGIVPLQPESHAPKPIDLLKNDIASENADALFDPIIPLPSPGKVRPKLKPVPRLGPHRRNSIQGSASESEDESRRGLNAAPSTPAPRPRYDSHTSMSTLQSLPNRDVSRVRNDSICSTTSQVTNAQVVGSPVKEKQSSKTRRQEMNRRMIASKRRREMVKKEAMTMYDLIFYNPSTNPIVPEEDEVKAAEKEKEVNKEEEKEKEEAQKPEETEATPVPQLKLGPNGEITLDESSLVIKRTARTAAAGVVVEGGWRAGAGGRYRRAPRSADWPPAETVRFYRALGALGTDFTLMAPLFPDRTRKELKLKFKKEEKLNCAQVEKALRSAGGWDVARLRDEFTAERAEAHERERRERELVRSGRQAERARVQQARTSRVRCSKATQAVESNMLPGVSHQDKMVVVCADDVVENIKNSRARTAPETNNSNSVTKTVRPKVKAASGVGLTTISPRTTFLSPDKNVGNTALPKVPTNIESGSLVVLTVDDPTSPGKKMLQTYISEGPGKLTPVALPAMFLNSVVGYMKKRSTVGSTSSSVSSPLMSPASVNSDSQSSVLQSPVPPRTILHLKPI